MIAEKDGPIGRLIFNNPARHNAVSLEMWQAVAQIMEDFENDDAIRVIVVTGAGGKAFVSGADISEFKEKRANEEAAAEYAKISEAARVRLQETLKPTIAMIRGYCIGGGLATALSCDIRIAAEGSRFGIPAAKLGLGYAYDGISKLIDLVGPAYAREIFYTARQFTAEEALAMGLVNRVVPGDELEGYVKNYCDTIAANAPLTIRAAKQIVREALKDESQARHGTVPAASSPNASPARTTPKAAPPSWKSAARCSRAGEQRFTPSLSPHAQRSDLVPVAQARRECLASASGSGRNDMRSDGDETPRP